jgi:hypothetical protein
MSKDSEPETSSEIWGLARSATIPVLFAVTSVVAGTVGHLFSLQRLAPYSDFSTTQLLAEGFFRSFGFLVLGMGTVTSPDLVPFALLTLGRAAGLLFFFSAAIAGLGFVFAKRLRPVRVESWSVLGRLPGFSEQGHVIVCGVGDDGYTLAAEAIEAGRNVVAIDTERTDRTADLRTMGAVTFHGDARHDGVLARRAGLSEATDVFVTAESDATNGAIVETIEQQAATGAQSRVTDVTARIGDNRLRQALHEETVSTEGVHLQTYDVPDATARELLATVPVDDVVDLDQRVHVWLVGWTALTEALLNQLLHLMHYPDSLDRQVTIIAADPAQVEQDIADTFPGIDPDWWDDASMSAFVSALFPAIDVWKLPPSDMELLSDRTPLYDLCQQRDKLTVFADDTDERSLRALIATWGPKLDALARDFELDAHLVYRSQAETNWTPGLSAVETTAYTDFGDGCSLSSVRGDERDRVARHLALVYHLLYDEELVDTLPDRESLSPDPDPDIESVLAWLESLPAAARQQYTTAVWRTLPEYQRDSNRYAADHAAVKRRTAMLLDDESDGIARDTLRTVAESEHRRWCAEKILQGWEPLPSADEQQWETDDGEQALRDQRFHPDIQPVATLRDEMEGEWTKDVSQVEAILRHPDIVGYQPSSPE